MSHFSVLLIFILLVLPLLECVLFGVLVRIFGWELKAR
jgi:hypothetical protein